MPREVIYGGSLPYGDDDSGRSVIEVRWSKEASHVQVATKCIHAADHSTYIPEWVKQQLVDAGLHHTQMLTQEGDETPMIYTAQDGWFIDMDRRGMNDLIRHLRRARDQAFGRDE